MPDFTFAQWIMVAALFCFAIKGVMYVVNKWNGLTPPDHGSDRLSTPRKSRARADGSER